jgi:hypothetical protein
MRRPLARVRPSYRTQDDCFIGLLGGRFCALRYLAPKYSAFFVPPVFSLEDQEDRLIGPPVE